MENLLWCFSSWVVLKSHEIGIFAFEFEKRRGTEELGKSILRDIVVDSYETK